MTESATRPAESSEPSRLPLPLALLKACRPKQWAKNVLVFVAPAAAGVLTQSLELRLTLQGFVAFCLVSSATYLLNDVLDVESDRRHPKKRLRPIASGAVPIPAAIATAVVLFIAGVALAAFTNWTLAGIVAGYAVLTTAYSLFLKQVAVLDLVILSAGFILRLLGGAYAAGVEVSEWFLLVSLFGSLFIAGAKRFAEKQELGDEAAALRPTLGAYSVEYLGFVRSVAAAAVMICYCQWAVESGDSGRYATPWVQLSIIPFVIAILRYALLVDHGEGSAPEEVLSSDRQMQLMGGLLVVCLFLAVYV
ncbi:MAG: decaprenyl-phosphate phosphoribosyltransferase [Microthrixaceae bacterium]